MLLENHVIGFLTVLLVPSIQCKIYLFIYLFIGMHETENSDLV